MLARPVHLLHRQVDAPEGRDQRQAEAAVGRLGDELRHPAVVRAGARPLQLGVRAHGREREVAAEGRGVLLGEAVHEEDLGRDAVGVEHFVAPAAVPRAGEPVALALCPLEALLAHLEHLARLLEHGQACLVLHVELVAVLGVEVVPIDLGPRAGVAVRGDDEIAIHGVPSVPVAASRRAARLER